MDIPGAPKLGFREKRQLADWLEWKGIGLRLLYSALRDGCDPAAFHRLCDGRRPTVTIAYNLSGFVFGGYTGQAWASSGGTYIYGNDEITFIFRLKETNGTWSPIKFADVDKASVCIYSHTSHGPDFGRNGVGEALRLFSGTHNFKDIGGQRILSNPSPAFSLANAFNTYGTNNNVLHGGDAQFLDIQVYEVSELPYMMLVDEENPWRKFSLPWNEKTLQDLQSLVRQYHPIEQVGVKQARILMVGPVGAGKSSFFNTVQSASRGEICPAQAAAGSTTHSLTTKFRTYQVRAERGGRAMNFQMCDTMGLEEEEGVMVADFDHFLEGHVPDRYQFNPAVGVSKDTPGFIKYPSLSQKTHVLVLVVDSSALPVMSPTLLEKLKVIKDMAVRKAIPVAILLTKVDRLSEAMAATVRNVYHSDHVREAVDDIADRIGLPRSQVYVVKNYEHEREVDLAVDILVLDAMWNLLRLADLHFDEQCDYLMAQEEKKS